MKNIDEKILMAKKISSYKTKRKKLISQQKQEERKKRDRRLYEKGGFWRNVYLLKAKTLAKDEFYPANHIPKYQRSSKSKNTKNHREARTKQKSKYKARGRNENRGIVPCLQRARLYTLKGVCVLRRLLQRAYQLTLIRELHSPTEINFLPLCTSQRNRTKAIRFF